MPDPATVTAGGTQLFSAIAYDQYDNVVSGVSYSWTTNMGIIDATGTLTAQTTADTGSVVAWNGTVNDSATVNVIPGQVDHIIVMPGPISVYVGGTQQFTATAYDQFNNPISGVGFTWTTDMGSVDAGGLFTAQTGPGSGNVTATNGSIVGSAAVDVIVADIDHITITSFFLAGAAAAFP